MDGTGALCPPSEVPGPDTRAVPEQQKPHYTKAGRNQNTFQTDTFSRGTHPQTMDKATRALQTDTFARGIPFQTMPLPPALAAAVCAPRPGDSHEPWKLPPEDKGLDNPLAEAGRHRAGDSSGGGDAADWMSALLEVRGADLVPHVNFHAPVCACACDITLLPFRGNLPIVFVYLRMVLEPVATLVLESWNQSLRMTCDLWHLCI